MTSGDEKYINICMTITQDLPKTTKNNNRSTIMDSNNLSAVPKFVTRIVSGARLTTNLDAVNDVTVKQTPLTAMESPITRFPSTISAKITNVQPAAVDAPSLS